MFDGIIHRAMCGRLTYKDMRRIDKWDKKLKDKKLKEDEIRRCKKALPEQGI